MNSSAARQINELSYAEKQRKFKMIEGNRRNRRVNAFKSGLFLTVSISIFALTLMYYVSLTSQITGLSKEISGLQTSLNELKLDNDENYSRITSDVNLEDIRRVAIQELGMQYADEGQIIMFNGEDSDYVRQIGKIPSASK